MDTSAPWARRFPAAVAVLIGLGMTAAGVWAMAAPRSFADFVDFEHHEHFLHDLGAFQIGLGVMLLLGAVWADAMLTTLVAFLVANTLHTVNHVTDRDLGGADWQAWALAVVSLLVAVAAVLRWRHLGYVVGGVAAAASPELAPFVRQKTVSLTTYRRDGRPGSSPVSIAVDGDRAYLRSFEQSLKTRRLARDPAVAVAPATGRGRPLDDGAGVLRGRMRRLEGEEYRYAARLLRRKHPFLHGVLVPLTHRLGRSKTGRTVHFELTPEERKEPEEREG